MALANYAAYQTAVEKPAQTVHVVAAATNSSGRLLDNWTIGLPIGTAPTTAAAPTRTTTGALDIQNGGTSALGIVGAQMALHSGMVLICDRLSHQGGLSGTVTTAQTTNLPTAALTRYTDGVGVMLGLTIYTQIGTTATTVSASYTNQAGTSGQTTPLVAFGGTGFREATRCVLLPLASGDTGVRAVASVTVTATTGTAGAFGVTLFKPLYAIIGGQTPSSSVVVDLISGNTGGGLPEIVDDACLFTMTVFPSGQSPNSFGSLFLTEW